MTDDDRAGRVPLHYAASGGEVEKVRRLLQETDNPDPRDAEGWTPLLFAARAAHTDIVRLLLDAGAQVDAVGPPLTVGTLSLDLMNPSAAKRRSTSLY